MQNKSDFSVEACHSYIECPCINGSHSFHEPSGNIIGSVLTGDANSCLAVSHDHLPRTMAMEPCHIDLCWWEGPMWPVEACKGL